MASQGAAQCRESEVWRRQEKSETYVCADVVVTGVVVVAEVVVVETLVVVVDVVVVACERSAISFAPGKSERDGY